MKIKRFVGGNLAANGYVIYQRDGGSCYIIDPGYSPKKFIKYIGEHQLAASGILLIPSPLRPYGRRGGGSARRWTVRF